MQEIILASKSPDRIKLLDGMGIAFSVHPSAFNEQLDNSRDVEAVAKELALGKARDVAKSYPESYVIGADTIIAVDGRQLGKPADINEAREMLLALAGRKCTVSTGLAIVNKSLRIEIIEVDSAKVSFKPNSDEVIYLREKYLSSGDWMGKVGGLGIQSGAAPLVDEIDGSYNTIIGLPAQLLAGLLQELGIQPKQRPY